MKNIRSLNVWAKSHKLVLAVYRATQPFPTEERYGLTSQIRRAAASIPANIAEGCGRDSTAEFRQFLRQAGGSASELEYHLLLAHDLGLLRNREWQDLSTETVDVRRMLVALIKRLGVPVFPKAQRTAK
jgi:four helix bundle protein